MSNKKKEMTEKLEAYKKAMEIVSTLKEIFWDTEWYLQKRLIKNINKLNRELANEQI